MAERIVIGQRVGTTKTQRAEELRRAMTPAERLLWAELRGNQLDGLHFRRQQIIGGFITDFYCHAAHLVIELDGGVHADQGDYDEKRDSVLTTLGLTILRIPNEAVEQDMLGVLARIAAACGN